jgi:hypothetical protein
MTDSSVVTDDGMISVNCGRCGKSLWVALPSLNSRRTYDCSECQSVAAESRDGTEHDMCNERKTVLNGQTKPSEPA